jgi:hypothetical protein
MLSSNVALVATRNITGHVQHCAEAIRLHLFRQSAIQRRIVTRSFASVSFLACRWTE